MTKQEFENLTKTTTNAEDFEIINFVYTFHPSIRETDGKQQITELYTLVGMRTIHDMHPTACKAKALEEDIRKKSIELENLRELLKELRG